MDRGTRIFWGILAMLFGASLFFAVQSERARRQIQRAGAKVETGELVTLASVTDGDSVIVKNAGDDVVVRIVGVKALESGTGKEGVGSYGDQAKNALHRALVDKPVRVLVGAPPKDKHGRTLATLWVDDEDVGLRLVKQGDLLVYTA